MKLKKLLYLPIFFLFLPTFAFWVPFLNGAYLYLFLVIYTMIVILVVYDNTKIYRKLVDVYKHTPIKYYIWTLILVALNSIFLSIIGKTTFTQTFRSIILQMFLFILPILGYFIYIIDRYIKYEKFISIFIISCWIMFVCGFICYFGQLFDITFINKTFEFFTCLRSMYHSGVGLNLVISQTSNYSAFGLPRLSCFFEEASFLACFIFFLLPFFYSITETNEKVLKSKTMDFIIKKTIVPFAWICLILTMSPIYLIFGCMITIIYYIKNIISFIKNNLIIVTVFFILTLASSFLYMNLVSIDLSETYLSRIINVITNLKNMSLETLIDVEASLATRIVSYINMLLIFAKNIFTGVGMGNISSALYYQMLNTSTPLTDEIIRNLTISSICNSKFTHNNAYLYVFLAENGIFAFCIFALFNFKLYSLLKKIKSFNLFTKGTILFQTLKGLLYSFFCLIVIYAYNSSYLQMEIFIYYFLSIALCYRVYLMTKEDNK